MGIDIKNKTFLLISLGAILGALFRWQIDEIFIVNLIGCFLLGFFNSLNISYKKLIIPHPRVSERDFVLLPLFDIDPFFKHPQSKKSIKALTTELKTTYIKKSIRQPKEMFVIH